MHDVAMPPAEYDPIAHLGQLPKERYEPASQEVRALTHASGLVAPVEGVVLPAAHGVHE